MASQDARLSKFEAISNDNKLKESQVNESGVGQEDEGSLGNTNLNPHLQPDPLASIATEQVRKINSMLESVRLVPRSSNAKFICSKEDDGEVMFIEIIRDDEPQCEDPNKGEGSTMEGPAVEYFDTFPTRDELTYHRKLNPREDANGGVSNFTGSIKVMHIFVGNFTYIVDFIVIEDISSIIDPGLTQVVLGKSFIEISNMTHDQQEGVVRFVNRNDEVAYKMPHMIEQYNSLSNLEKEHTKSIYLRNEEDKRRGVESPSNWLERLPAGSITAWEDLTTRFLAQFFPPERIAKLRNDILMFQQHHGESLSEAWTRFKDLLQKCEIDHAADDKLRNKNADESWEIIENLALYDHKGWNDTKEFVKPVKAISTPQGISKMSDRRILKLEDQINFLLKESRPTTRSSTHIPHAYANAVHSKPRPQSHNEPSKLNPFTFRERTGPSPQP
ncbi:retrotransposon ORF1 [Tanacetum coccineum]